MVYALIGQPINLILTVYLNHFVVAMSDVIILFKYMDELRTGKNKIDAIKRLSRSWLATLMTSVTTAIGLFLCSL